MDAPHWTGEPGAVSTDKERRPRRQHEPFTDIPAGMCERPGCDRSLNFFRVSIQGLGTFCSRLCADKAQAAQPGEHA
jgi:hypothetical protein